MKKFRAALAFALLPCLACTRNASTQDAAGWDTGSEIEGATADIPPDEDAKSTSGQDTGASFRVLVFSRTAGFRHDSIPAAQAALFDLAQADHFVADMTEDPARFSTKGLAPYQVVVFLLTSGDVLDDAQQAAFETWMSGGRGYVGVHSASDTEYGWPFYGLVVGAYFSSHPAIQPATVRIHTPGHPAVAGLPAIWMRTDEWYNFKTNPRALNAAVSVLLMLDESSYSGGTQGPDHPIVWAGEIAGGRSFYTAMGHTQESYADPVFRQHLLGGIRWAARRSP